MEGMGTDSRLKTQLDHKLTMLPDDGLREILGFVESLLSKKQNAQDVIGEFACTPQHR